MFNAIGLYHFRWRKKKAKSFIIPPTYFRNSGYSIVEVKPSKEENQPITEAVTTATVTPSETNAIEEATTTVEVITATTEITNAVPQVNNQVQTATTPQLKVSALSLGSIRAKRELEAQLNPVQKHHDELPTEPFTETEMLEQWLKYAQRLGDKGYKIVESLLLINDPKLDGTTIIHELPNESSKIDFEGEKHDLLGYLRGKLHNHNITIEIKLNENIELKKAFTTEEKYERLKEINPALDLLRKTFDLDL
ncbi:MAG TPA: hypothetical protein VJL37_07675 [Flavobacterium sp.]|nr:hypothetical protein [Flavobacterium sp.]